MLILIFLFLAPAVLGYGTGVDQLDPLIEEKYKGYKTFERTVLPAYRRKGSEFSLLIRSYRWEETTSRRVVGAVIKGVVMYNTVYDTHYHYRNTVELYFNDVFLQDFKNVGMFEKEYNRYIKLPMITVNSVVPVMPNDLNDPKEFYVFYDMNGSCVLVKIENPQRKRKLIRKNVNCSLMKGHRKQP